MTLQQSTTAWFWLLSVLLLLRWMRHPVPLINLAALAVLVILTRAVAEWIIHLDPDLAERWIPPTCALGCLILLIALR